jgi:hypothetical protein
MRELDVEAIGTRSRPASHAFLLETRSPELNPMVLSLVLPLLMAGAPEAADADPLARARAGEMQCDGPDVAHRTCKAISTYVFAADGAVTNQSESLISASGPMIMRTTSRVSVRDGAVCGPVSGEDIDQAQLVFAGRPINGQQADQVKAQLKSGLGPMLGAEICTRFSPAENNGYTTRVTVNGQAAPPDAGVQVIWIKPGDGWTVAP